jgi:hypothetical protein
VDFSSLSDDPFIVNLEVLWVKCSTIIGGHYNTFEAIQTGTHKQGRHLQRTGRMDACPQQARAQDLIKEQIKR